MEKITFQDIQVPKGSKFKDISGEAVRVYRFPDMGISITEPIALQISQSGGHYVIDSVGQTHYIPAGWRELVWAPKPDIPHVSFHG